MEKKGNGDEGRIFSLFRPFAAGFRWAFEQVYYIGLQTLRYSRRAARRLGRWFHTVRLLLGALVHFVWVAADRYLLQQVHWFRQEWQHLHRDIRSAVRTMRSNRKAGRSQWKALWLYIRAGLRRHRKLIVSFLVNGVLPLLAIIAVAQTASHWNNMTFALKVTYEGENLGYITDESVYTSAKTLLQERIVGTDSKKLLKESPVYTLNIVQPSRLIDARALCDRLISAADQEVTSACGIYIDGTFLCAVKNEADIDSVLDHILLQRAPNLKQGERADFVEEIRKEQGMYPQSSVWSIEKLSQTLNSTKRVAGKHVVTDRDAIESICARYGITETEFRQMNPGVKEIIYTGDALTVSKEEKFLQVQITRVETYREAVKFSTQEVSNSRKFKGYRQIITPGKDGVQQVTAMVTYVDGVETKRTELSRTTLQEPVTQKIEVGTKSTSAYGSYSVTTTNGRFIWPAVGLNTVNSKFGQRWNRQHKGIDIIGGNAYGKIIVAVEDGTVEFAGFKSNGYGNQILINHGGGIKTRYAHCSSVSVHTGEHVSQGQAIGRVGNTGRSFGAHLHFEVIVNGTAVNPLPYLGR